MADFLKFGMQNEKSKSLFHRMLAKGVLAAEKKKADLYEAYLNKKQFSFPDAPEEDAALLKKIREQINDRNTE